MSLLRLIGSGALSLWPQAPQSSPPAAQIEVPARRPIAGLSGFQSVSSVRYSEAPDVEHELTCTYVFPARARWQVAVPEQPQLGRHVEFRYGERYFEMAQSADRSREVARSNAQGVEWSAKCELLELRLAVFLWPDGFEWREDGLHHRARGECGRELVALLDADGRPTLVRFAGEPERVEEELRISAWREQRGRWWPAALEFWQSGQMIWREHVATLTTQVALLDTYFLPPDRRGVTTGSRDASVLHFDAPAQTEVRESVVAGADWKHAQELWRSLASRIDAQLPPGWERLPNATFELNADGSASAAVVRLRGRGTAPAFATSTAACQALTTPTEWPPSQTSQALLRLEAAKPSDAKSARRLLTLRGELLSATTADLTLLIERAR